jgi:AsmA-like C-terminal region
VHQNRVKWSIVALTAVVVAVGIEAALLVTHWPFTRSAVMKSLRQEAEGEVAVQDFHQVFFPRPGCVARGVVIRHGSDASVPPLVTVERLTIAGDYASLLTFSKQLREIRAERMHIRIPQKSDRSPHRDAKESSSTREISIQRFIAEESVLEFAPKDPSDEPFVIQIHRTVLSPATTNAAMSFETSLRIPEPPGDVQAKGRFGPWDKSDPFQTPVSGTYSFEHADLGKFRGLGGTLGSTGRFEGTVASIDVNGETDVEDFRVHDASHGLHLKAGFRAMVSGRTGDVGIRRVETRFLRTAVISEGAVAAPGTGFPKTVSLDIAVNDGRIQDLLRLVSSRPPGMTGEVSLRCKAGLPPGDRPFLEKLTLTGQIGIDDARFTNSKTQHGLERISRNALHGEDDPAGVVSDVRGRVSVANGVATLSRVTFRVPGAWAAMSGTYHLVTHRVDLRGTVHLEENLSQTTKGVKSFLLKALDPFFRKKKHLSVVPIRITGTYGNTSIKLDL